MSVAVWFLALATFGCITPCFAAAAADHGYGSLCEEGYGEDCPLGQGRETSSASEAGKPDASKQPPAVSGAAGCVIKAPNACTFPFSYKGKSYYTCTDIDVIGTKWCSTNSTYGGHWRRCTESCKQQAPVQAIVTGAVTSAVAAAGIGLMAAAAVHEAQAKATTTTTVTAATATMGAIGTAAPTALPMAPPVVPPVVESSVPVSVTAIPVAVPVSVAAPTAPAPFVASRKFEMPKHTAVLEKSVVGERGRAPQASSFLGTEATILYAGLGLCLLCCFVGACSATVAILSGSRKRSKRHVTPIMPCDPESQPLQARVCERHAFTSGRLPLAEACNVGCLLRIS